MILKFSMYKFALCLGNYWHTVFVLSTPPNDPVGVMIGLESSTGSVDKERRLLYR